MRTEAQQRSRFLLNNRNTPTAILFGHVKGDEITLAVSTEAGKKNSVANKLEEEQAVRLDLSGVEKKGFEHVSVCTIMKSQGSKWPYVIVSKVRASSRGWLGKKLGYNGLCILGNSHLLECSELWKKLLSHYQAQNCVLISAQNIKVWHNC
uniref:Uncharacterized protein n=1 Tax=Electrophorus electricus TaxID=8005 RepID=A0A4W4DS81_ELEEL